MQPRCPHCKQSFPTWPRARMHVKYCRKGHPRETVAESVARRNRVTGTSAVTSAATGSRIDSHSTEPVGTGERDTTLMSGCRRACRKA